MREVEYAKCAKARTGSASDFQRADGDHLSLRGLFFRWVQCEFCQLCRSDRCGILLRPERFSGGKKSDPNRGFQGTGRHAEEVLCQPVVSDSAALLLRAGSDRPGFQEGHPSALFCFFAKFPGR